MNLSLGDRLGKIFISGSAVTPTDDADMSPIDRVIASPGTYLFFSQTRLGPYNIPALVLYPGGVIPGVSLDYSILPLHFLILAASSGSSGLWSLES